MAAPKDSYEVKESKGAHMKSVLAFLVGLLIACGMLGSEPPNAEAATYYIANNGNNTTGNGSKENPWATFGKARPLLVPGDSVFFRAGSYGLGGTIPNGTATQPITIRNEPGEMVIFRNATVYMGSYNVIEGDAPVGLTYNLIFEQSISAVRQSGQRTLTTNVRLKNFEIRNIIVTAAMTCGRFWEFINIYAHDIGAGSLDHAIYCADDDVLVDGGVYRNNAGYSLQITKSGGTPEQQPLRWTIRNVLFEGDEYSTPAEYGLYMTGHSHWIYNNVFRNFPCGALTIHSGPSYIVNNTFYHNGHLDDSTACNKNTFGDMRLTGPSTAMNNLIYQSGFTHPINLSSVGAQTSAVLSNNFCLPLSVDQTRIKCALYGDPLFVDAPQGDFRLQAGSPASEAGATVVEVAVDRDEVERPQGLAHDIGAYELVPPEAQLAPGVIIATSGNLASTHPVEHLFDGCADDVATCKTGNVGIASFWLTMDLGAPYRLTRARLFGDNVGTWTSVSWSLRTACFPEGPWTTVFTNEPSLGSQWFEEALDNSARYVRVEVFGNPAFAPGRTEARELEVYGRVGSCQ
jgi:hypothetical protein